MTALLVSLLAIAAGGWLWSNARAASEAAIHHGHRACRQAGVQWLDQSVHLVKLRLRRGQNGRLGLERHYRFEYSRDGDDRHSGRVVLFGTELVEMIGPASHLPTVH